MDEGLEMRRCLCGEEKEGIGLTHAEPGAGPAQEDAD